MVLQNVTFLIHYLKSADVLGHDKKAGVSNLRKCKSHQCPTDHNEVQNVPQVSEVGSRMKQQTKVNHLKQRHSYYICWFDFTTMLKAWTIEQLKYFFIKL